MGNFVGGSLQNRGKSSSIVVNIRSLEGSRLADRDSAEGHNGILRGPHLRILPNQPNGAMRCQVREPVPLRLQHLRVFIYGQDRGIIRCFAAGTVSVVPRPMHTG